MSNESFIRWCAIIIIGGLVLMVVGKGMNGDQYGRRGWSNSVPSDDVQR